MSAEAIFPGGIGWALGLAFAAAVDGKFALAIAMLGIALTIRALWGDYASRSRA